MRTQVLPSFHGDYLLQKFEHIYDDSLVDYMQRKFTSISLCVCLLLVRKFFLQYVKNFEFSLPFESYKVLCRESGLQMYRTRRATIEIQFFNRVMQYK